MLARCIELLLARSCVRLSTVLTLVIAFIVLLLLLSGLRADHVARACVQVGVRRVADRLLDLARRQFLQIGNARLQSFDAMLLPGSAASILIILLIMNVVILLRRPALGSIVGCV